MKKTLKIFSIMFIFIGVLLLSSCKSKYEVTFKTYDNKVLKVVKVKHGSDAKEPNIPLREGYSFVGWDKEFTNVKKNIVVNAMFEINNYTITFETNGGSSLKELTYEYNEIIKTIKNTKKENYRFLGWYIDESFNTIFDYEKMPSKDLTLYAKWEEIIDVVMTFNPRVNGLETIVLSVPILEDGLDPFLNNPKFVKEGYLFKGWYTTKKGPYWDEPDKKSFPLTINYDIDLYAYWEPIDSKDIDYDSDQTYYKAINHSGALNLNPFTYENEYEKEIIDMMVAPFYQKTINWDTAIKLGLADYPGDFSNFEDDTYSIDMLFSTYETVMVKNFPVNEKDQSALLNGKFNDQLAITNKGKEWTFELKKNLMFEDGTIIDASVIEYTLKSWLDPKLNHGLSELMFTHEDMVMLSFINNAFNYHKGVVPWGRVGIELDPFDQYKFTIKVSQDITVMDAMNLMSTWRLINPTKYDESYNETLNRYDYGTTMYPFSSYGPYIVKNWIDEEEISFNKNYNYIFKHLINFKSQSIKILSDMNDANDLFEEDLLSELELTNDNYLDYLNNDKVLDTYTNAPLSLIINQAGTKVVDGQKRHKILSDKRFRQALLHGLNKVEFANTIYGPNKPNLLPITNIGKNYFDDTKTYIESEQHINLIEQELGWDLKDYGYDPTLAVTLFNEAYKDWLKEDNEGPVTLKYVTDETDVSKRLDTYIKESYEQLFKDEKGNKRLIIDVNVLSAYDRQLALRYHDFDLALTGVGFNVGIEAWWQYIAIGIIPAEIGAASYGLSYPYIGQAGKYKIAEYMYAEIEVNFKNTLNYINEIELLPVGYQTFLNLLDEEGVYKGTVEDIVFYFLENDVNPFLGNMEPFEGASAELYNLTSQIERVFLDYVPMVPLISHSMSKVYADNVVVEWPSFSAEFGWGLDQYRYLNTDPDFIN